MKRIVKITYAATDEEIETVRRFYNLLDLMDEETYDDFDNRVGQDGVYEAIRWLLEAMQED